MINWKEIIGFPAQVIVNATIKKVELKKHHYLNGSDLKMIDSVDIQQIQLLASINKPMANIGPYQDQLEDYRQLYFIRIQISIHNYKALYKSIAKLIHQVVPHHCIIIIQSDDGQLNHFSLATKRLSRQSSNERVIEEIYLSELIDAQDSVEFMDSLAYVKIPKQNLKVFYSYYIQTLKNHALIGLTGHYVQRPDYVTDEYLQIDQKIKIAEEKIAGYLKTLNMTTQMNEKVALNIDIYELKQEIQRLREKIK